MQSYRYIHLTNGLFKLLTKTKNFISLLNKKSKHKLNIIRKYYCKIKKEKAIIYITDTGIVTKQDIYIGKILYEDIKKVIIKEKIWCIRVRVFAYGQYYNFDFKCHKQASKFYQDVISGKNLS